MLEECRHASLKDMHVVSLDEWIELIREKNHSLPHNDHSPDAEHVVIHLVGRLVNFYESVLGSKDVPAFPETIQTERRSALLSTVPTIQQDWVRKWTREWIQELTMITGRVADETLRCDSGESSALYQ